MLDTLHAINELLARNANTKHAGSSTNRTVDRQHSLQIGAGLVFDLTLHEPLEHGLLLDDVGETRGRSPGMNRRGDDQNGPAASSSLIVIMPVFR